MAVPPIPAEWAPHRAMWIGWPSHRDLWVDNLEETQGEVEALVRALAGPGREQVKLMVGSTEALAGAQSRFEGVAGVTVVPGLFGDIWLRDTGPIFGEGSKTATAFRFNGWGGKYEYEFDDTVATQIGEQSCVALSRIDAILEGGSLDHDGAGTILTTRQCLLNPNRNADWTEEKASAVLGEALGATRVVWLGDGLLNDHTDGHVDNLARFVAPGVVACPIGFGVDDPNTDVYNACAADLAAAGFEVVRIPSPGRIENEDGEPVPASHMNFLIANGAVVVPTYGNVEAGEAARGALAKAFPNHEIILSPSVNILTGGGSFHCISQQEPA
ncbi:agmatine deiminase family protein [Brevundimonas sp. NIBR11]|uniref:agmatine deiminase family protein n=1 Tax=Brevundimonas sp. NIBR11 TaxID=3015999 RepID=UPI0022F09112|nr:agmatine deiminase family protein [Brevundimonas sp. NIBR11]WGM32259.1 Agmatine deiminase [Brevundimonas sp. NIBR11]